MMMNAKNITYTNGKSLHECYIATVTAVVASIVFFVGLLANIVLLCLVLRKLASGKRNDKLFLLNIIASNLFSLFGSLLGEIIGRGNIIPSAQIYCIFYHQASFISLFNNVTSMAALCYNMYENIIKFPGNRLLNFSLSSKIVAGSWVLSLVLVPAKYLERNIWFCHLCLYLGICENASKYSAREEIASFFSVIVLVSIWIAVFTRIIRMSLTGISSKLKQHREQTEQVLHNISRVNVVSFNKQAYSMVFSYYICWIPFGFSAALVAANVISFHSCVYFVCLVGAHASAASTTLIYLTIDKRFRIKCCSNHETAHKIGAN